MYKKTKIITLKRSIAAVLITLTAIAVTVASGAEKDTPKAVSNDSLAPEFLYVVREYDGKVAVFTPDSELPEEIYETYVSSLPEIDREYLSKGIYIKTGTELEEIIEDLTS